MRQSAARRVVRKPSESTRHPTCANQPLRMVTGAWELRSISLCPAKTPATPAFDGYRHQPGHFPRLVTADATPTLDWV